MHGVLMLNNHKIRCGSLILLKELEELLHVCYTCLISFFHTQTNKGYLSWKMFSSNSKWISLCTVVSLMLLLLLPFIAHRIFLPYFIFVCSLDVSWCSLFFPARSLKSTLRVLRMKIPSQPLTTLPPTHQLVQLVTRS